MNNKTVLTLALSVALGLAAGQVLAASGNDAGVTGNGIGAPGSSNTNTRDSADDSSSTKPSTHNKTGKAAAPAKSGDKQQRVLTD